MKNRTLWIVTISAMIIGLFFGRIWFNRLRLDYNLNGRYFDKSSSVVYDEDSVFGYGILALFFISIGMVSWVIILRAKPSEIKECTTDCP